MERLRKASAGKRNAEIDFYRIFFAVCVLCYHGSRYIMKGGEFPFRGGYLGVEFFFILIGYFAVKKVAGNPEATYRDAAAWSWKKIKGFLAFTIPIGGVHILLYMISCGESNVFKWLINGMYEMFLLRAGSFGDSHYYALGPLWFLSGVLIVLPLFYALLIKHRNLALYIICPLSCLLIYGYFSMTIGHINSAHEWWGVLISGVPRAWAGLCLGGAAYLLSENLRKWKPFTMLGAGLLGLFQIAAFAGVAVYMIWCKQSKLDFIVIFAMLLLVVISISGRSPVGKIVPYFFSRISEFSMALYVTHWTVLQVYVLGFLKTVPTTTKLIVYFAGAVAYALLWWGIISFVRRLHLVEKGKGLLFEKGCHRR